MKLPDFKEHALLNALRNAMDAPYLHVDLTGEELIRWLDKDESETLGYSGMRVLIYIRDVKGILPKFHTSHCGTLTTMINKNRSWRYVVTTRKDGDFRIRRYKWSGGYDVVDERLEVCKRCLKKLNYKDYNKKPGEQHIIYGEFDIREFFERYSKTQASWVPLYPYYRYRTMRQRQRIKL